MQINKISPTDYRYKLLSQIPKYVIQFYPISKDFCLVLDLYTNININTKYEKFCYKKTLDNDGWITYKKYIMTNDVARVRTGKYLATIHKHISNDKIDYCYHYKRESYYGKLVDFQKTFEKKYETINDSDFDFRWQRDNYLNYLEDKYFHEWWNWRANFNRQRGLTLLRDKCFCYDHCSTGYIEEDYDISEARIYLSRFYKIM